MPIETFYSTSAVAVGTTFGGDVGVGASTWVSVGNAAGQVDSALTTFAAPATVASWISENIEFGGWVWDGDGTSSISARMSALATLLGLTPRIFAVSAPSGILVYGRVRSAQTNASAGTREGGFTLPTVAGSSVDMNSGGNPIFGGRAGTPIASADLRGANFKIMAGFLQADNNGGAGRTPSVDAMRLIISWDEPVRGSNRLAIATGIGI